MCREKIGGIWKRLRFARKQNFRRVRWNAGLLDAEFRRALLFGLWRMALELTGMC